MAGKKLSPKQKRFCEEYLVDCNGAGAAIRAGYAPKAAKEQASDLLTKPNIKKYIAELQFNLRQKTEITAEMVVKELAKIGFANIQDYLGADNTTVDLSAIDRQVAAPIAGVKVTTTTGGQGDFKWTAKAVEFKLADKKGALELLGKHLGIFEKDNNRKLTVIKGIEEIEIVHTTK